MPVITDPMMAGAAEVPERERRILRRGALSKGNRYHQVPCLGMPLRGMMRPPERPGVCRAHSPSRLGVQEVSLHLWDRLANLDVIVHRFPLKLGLFLRRTGDLNQAPTAGITGLMNQSVIAKKPLRQLGALASLRTPVRFEGSAPSLVRPSECGAG